MLLRGFLRTELFSMRFPQYRGARTVYSETCIKRTPSIERTVAEVPKFISLVHFK